MPACACVERIGGVRRWEQDEAVPNPFRMDAAGPPARNDAKAKLQTRQVCNALLAVPYLLDEVGPARQPAAGRLP